MVLKSAARVGPRSVAAFLPSMKTGAVGVSPVPGSEMPMSACLLSPGPLTMQPITATLRASTPGYCVFHPGIESRMKLWMSRASSWKVVEVVRPQPGQAATSGTKTRKPMVCRISCATLTSWVRSPPGSGVSEIRIVSPIPCCSRMPRAAEDATTPFEPMPASVRPRWIA